MARMSIDDKFLRDGRVKLLGQRLGWSRRETMGALLDVFAVAYDREDDILSAAEIEAAAEKHGFVIALIAVGLGEEVAGGVRIKGAAERIEYLAAKREAGRKGGRKSGETRRNRLEAKRSTASPDREAVGNPPDPVPDLVPDPVPEDQKALSARTIPPSPVPAAPPRAPEPVPQQPAPIVPAVSQPAHVREDIARTKPAAPAPGAYDPTDDSVRGKLARLTYRRVSDARLAIARELGLPEQLPFPEITPVARPLRFQDLLERIREEGAHAVAACDRVVENLIAQARDERSIEWLDPKAFGSGAWNHARNRVAPPVARAAAAKPRRKPDQPLQVSTLTPDERVALAAEARAALYGAPARAGPASAPPTDDDTDEQPEPARTPA